MDSTRNANVLCLNNNWATYTIITHHSLPVSLPSGSLRGSGWIFMIFCFFLLLFLFNAIKPKAEHTHRGWTCHCVKIQNSGNIIIRRATIRPRSSSCKNPMNPTTGEDIQMDDKLNRGGKKTIKRVLLKCWPPRVAMCLPWHRFGTSLWGTVSNCSEQYSPQLAYRGCFCLTRGSNSHTGVRVGWELVTAKALAYNVHHFHAHDPFRERSCPVDGGIVIWKQTTAVG